MKKRILWALAACLLLVLAAGGAQAEGEKVYTSGDYTYTLNSYGEATLLSMPAPDAFAFGAKKLTIIAPEGSYAAEFAVQNGFNYQPAK